MIVVVLAVSSNDKCYFEIDSNLKRPPAVVKIGTERVASYRLTSPNNEQHAIARHYTTNITPKQDWRLSSRNITMRA
jgi:hypothetical protein